MSEGSLNRTLSRGVGRRIFGYFLLAAIVPMLFTAWLAWSEFSRGLQADNARVLKGAAKEYAIEILTRLQLAAEKAAVIERVAVADGFEAALSDDYLLDDFDAVWFPDDRPESDTTRALDSLDLSRETLGFLSNGNTKLLALETSDEVLMLREARFGAGDHRMMAFKLNLRKIWGPRENLPLNTEFCVFSETGVRHYCTADIGQGLHAALLDGAENRVNIVGEWIHEGEPQIAALWQLFLSGTFRSAPIDVVAIQPRVVAMQPIADFKRIFIPSTLLAAILVGYLALTLIAKSLTPLQLLTGAARRLAGGDLQARVRLHSNDEFQGLGDAFNDMADRLAQQISTLKAMSGIDRMILSGTRFEEVSEDVVRNLLLLTDCKSAAVIARDSDNPSVGSMISNCGDGAIFDRVELPTGKDANWCVPRQVNLEVGDEAILPYKSRFESYGHNYVIPVPVMLGEEVRGLLLLGSDIELDLTHAGMQRCADLAGRFAVALSSVEREETLYRQANFDPLTGLPNRQLLKDRLDQHIAGAKREDKTGALLFLDLDRFKEINDVYGHSAGDAVLVQAAQRIVSLVRDRDTVARLGGDEFVVLLPDVRHEGVARNMAERLLKRLAESFTVQDSDHYVGASIGIVMYPEDGDSVETLLKNADAAMYRAKDAGRSTFEFFSERLNAVSRRKISLERDLRNSFREGALELYYQPQFDIATDNISGAEALVRWKHPREGYVSPAEFVPLAEDSGLIVEIGAWVLQRACADLSELLKEGLHPGPLSINVSALQLRDEAFHNTVMDPIRGYFINPRYIQLEVTETALAQNRDRAIQLLEALRGEGVRVAIDDFGTGYSSLSYLQQMPFDVIKIDKSFVDRIGSGAKSDNICRTIIRMADELEKKSIAEGVENASQLDFLRRNGCHFVQGYHYSKPLPKPQFIELLSAQEFHTQRRKALEAL
ncbi:MAG: EAL domain-containing protein [Woeseiaceae bacterium]|nr:EAL domain-containing protein [Woeseiaceae bacterium]